MNRAVPVYRIYYTTIIF